jgi:hypothetical protein
VASDVYQTQTIPNPTAQPHFHGSSRPCSHDLSFLSGVSSHDSAHLSRQSFSRDSEVKQLPTWTGARMASEAHYCRECRAVTQHLVASSKDVAAHLCQECLLRWSTELDVKGKPVSGQVATRAGRRIQNANSKRRSETQDKNRRL